MCNLKYLNIISDRMLQAKGKCAFKALPKNNFIVTFCGITFCEIGNILKTNFEYFSRKIQGKNHTRCLSYYFKYFHKNIFKKMHHGL